MSESEVIAYVAGLLTIPAIQYVGWPYLKRYLGIKGKKGKKGKANNGNGGNPGKATKRYEIHVHLPKDEDEQK